MAKTLTVPIFLTTAQQVITSTTALAIASAVARLDTAHYDGSPVYTFEALLRPSQAVTMTLELWEVGGASALATLTHNAITQIAKRVTFTPVSGSTTYQLKAYSPSGSLNIMSARIMIAQTDPTKTCYEAPLTGQNQGSITTTLAELTYGLRVKYDAAKWANATFTLCGTGYNLAGSAATVTTSLREGSTAAVGSFVCTGTTTTYAESSALTLVDGSEYHVEAQGSAGVTSSVINVKLRVVLNPLTTCQVYLPANTARQNISNDWVNSTVSTTMTGSGGEIIADLANYAGVTLGALYVESTVKSAVTDGSDTIGVANDSTDDFPGGGTTVAASLTAITSATKQRVRSADIQGSWAAGANRYYGVIVKGASAGAATGYTTWVILELSGYSALQENTIWQSITEWRGGLAIGPQSRAVSLQRGERG